MIRMMLRKYFYLQSFSSRPVSRVNRPPLQGQWKESPHLGRKLLWIRFYREGFRRELWGGITGSCRGPLNGRFVHVKKASLAAYGEDKPRDRLQGRPSS
jgi:hypothetical protein